MKKTIKLLASVATAAAIFFATDVKAQTITPNKLRFGIGVEGGLVTGSAHDFSNAELGGTGRLQYGVSNNLAITLTSGYYNFFGKNEPGTNLKYQSLGMVPIKAGIKYFYTSNLYLGAEVGAGIETKTFLPQGVDENFANKDTKLILSPALGYATKHWDVGVRYENYSGQSNNYGLVALRLAYGFGL
ncbi:hypothetical protein JN11_03196 [Mucilaginibacter frigoritolerans]|uniref:Outer membrane protein with beta-barrel domain n=1 Tax=Mucilaginibacter frigoritolerans TaxID=652788 RepID=A0A562TX50_9SPHI|nr:hypothetical protein [Mucilaginibacter frigoritolerans]TWI98117.1 hypothetical protein JN11_03196 [Mucilaginibacter frigoritolerans]